MFWRGFGRVKRRNNDEISAKKTGEIKEKKNQEMRIGQRTSE